MTSLASAPRADVRESLKSLGLTWRADRIIAFARAAEQTDNWVEHLADLPGGGPYVAASVSLARNGHGSLPVDVTVARVVARYWGVQVAGEGRRDKAVLEAASSMGLRSRRFYYAWLDLAARACVPTAPACERCPMGACRSCRTDNPERSWDDSHAAGEDVLTRVVRH